MTQPSIFNDVLGPIMRGPSSSHSAGALRIGRLCRDLLQGDIKKVLIEYDPNGSLVTTHTSQGTDMGLYGGFLGWEADDSRLQEYQKYVDQSGMDINVKYISYGATHPNTYKLTLQNSSSKHQVIALSTGGGMIKVIEIDGCSVESNGDYYELLIYLDKPDDILIRNLQSEFNFDHVELYQKSKTFINIKNHQAFDTQILEEFLNQYQTVNKYRILNPVMPVLARKDMALPFTTCEEMLQFNKKHKFPLWRLALEYEKSRSGQSEQQLMDLMRRIAGIMREAIKTGLAGTQYHDRILPSQSVGFNQKLNTGQLLDSSILNQMILQVSALMEAKSSMQTIVAAPTAGSCGAMPGAVFACVTAINASEEKLLQALFIAGLIGVFIASKATFAAEEAGCMAECGSGASMAAAALVYLADGNIDQSLAAASMALQNSFGLVCDPIANRVEAPCLGKNVLAASNALSCTNMALSGYQHLIPLDEVIIAMADVGKAIPHELCCTGLGGLSTTPSAKKLEAKLLGKVAVEYNGKFKSC